MAKKTKVPAHATALERQLHSHLKAAYAADRDLTEYAVAKKMGVAQTVLRRFYAEGKTLSLTTAGKLAAVLDLGLAKNNSEIS
jgi:plasmid maintenance system antidote protein VapI